MRAVSYKKERAAHPVGKPRFTKTERGAALFMTVIIVSVTLAASLAIANIFIRELKIAGSLQQSTAAIFAADAGVETMLYDQWKDDNYCVTTTTLTPTLQMSSVDPNGDTIHYCVEIARDAGGGVVPPTNADGSFLQDSNFIGTWTQIAGCSTAETFACPGGGWDACPYASGATASFSTSSLIAGDYWWHARSKDSGTPTWSNFSQSTSFRAQ